MSHETSDPGSDAEDLEHLPFDVDIDPYKILGVERTVDQNEIKKAYYGAARRHHPDKVADDEKDNATKRFQQIQFAYSILSDVEKRKRYNETGSTTEATTLGEADFGWKDFFDSLMKINMNDIEEFEKKFKGSDEEKADVLVAYTKAKGNMDEIYENVILSNVLTDDERFRKIIKDAIENEQVITYKAFTHESDHVRKTRVKKARKEAKEAEEYARELNLPASFFSGKDAAIGDKKARKQNAEDTLKTLIQQRQQGRQQFFFDQLESKWLPPEKDKTEKGEKREKGKKGPKGSKENKRPIDEPPEEAFEKNRKKGKMEA
jgi:DnaJ homolog subfamily C member 9